MCCLLFLGRLSVYTEKTGCEFDGRIVIRVFAFAYFFALMTSGIPIFCTTSQWSSWCGISSAGWGWVHVS